MYTLTEKEFKAEAEPILRRVFSTDNPFASHPFAETIPQRRVLFGEEYDLKNMVSPLLLDALIAAASSVGDTGCYFTMLWRMNEEARGEFNHWYIPFSEISAYKRQDRAIFSLAFNAENVLDSLSAKWGIMTSHEYHGLLGGTHKFMDKVRQRIPDLDQQVYGFLELWQQHKTNSIGAQTDWLPGLLTQIYDEETALEMLRRVNLP